MQISVGFLSVSVDVGQCEWTKHVSYITLDGHSSPQWNVYTDTETETDKMDTELNGSLWWYLPLGSVNTTI